MTSRTTVLAVVICLGLFALATLAGSVVLIASDHEVPGELWALSGTAVGALASLLASTRSTLGPKDTEPTAFQANVVPSHALEASAGSLSQISWTAPQTPQTSGPEAFGTFPGKAA